MVNIPLLLAQESEEPGFWQSIFQTFFFWLLEWICGKIKPFIEAALALFPDSWATSFGEQIAAISYWLPVMNYWFPIDWLFRALAVFIAWRLGFIVALIIVKAIRGG